MQHSFQSSPSKSQASWNPYFSKYTMALLSAHVNSLVRPIVRAYSLVWSMALVPYPRDYSLPSTAQNAISPSLSSTKILIVIATTI